MLHSEHGENKTTSAIAKDNQKTANSPTVMASFASVSVAIILVILKFFAVKQSGSNAVLASLVDSGLDLVASLITLYSVRYAQEWRDDEHSFGHGKAEALAGVFQAGLVAVSCIMVGYSSIDRLIHPQALADAMGSIWVMVLSTILTLGLVIFQGWAISKTKSVATKADRAHYFSDLLSNIVAGLGVFVAANFGFDRADAIAGLFVSLWLLYGAWHILGEALNHLLDKEAPQEVRDEIQKVAEDSQDVLGVHDLRTRISGPWLHIQFHMELSGDLKLSEAHRIVVATENRVLAAFPNADIIIHPDPDKGAEPHGHPAFGKY